MPSPWNESLVNAVSTGAVQKRGGSRMVRVPSDWPLGAEVRLLLVPAPAKNGHANGSTAPAPSIVSESFPGRP